MATVSKSGCREVFRELQSMALQVLRERGLQGTFETKSLANVHAITIRREGRKYILSWFNAEVEETSRSFLHFRWNDHLSKWIREHVLFPERVRKRRRFARRKEERQEKRQRERRASRLSLSWLASEVCTKDPDLQANLQKWPEFTRAQDDAA